MFTGFLNFSGSEMESKVLRQDARPIWGAQAAQLTPHLQPSTSSDAYSIEV